MPPTCCLNWVFFIERMRQTFSLLFFVPKQNQPTRLLLFIFLNSQKAITFRWQLLIYIFSQFGSLYFILVVPLDLRYPIGYVVSHIEKESLSNAFQKRVMNDNNQIIAKCGSGGQPHPHALPFKNPFWLAVEKEKRDHCFNLVVCGRWW